MSELKKSWKLSTILVLLLVGLAAALGIFLYIKNRKKQSEPESDGDGDGDFIPETDDDETILDGYKTISAALTAEGIDDETMHRLVTAQALHEASDAKTGEPFASVVYKRNNNAFGMGHPSKRPTTSTGKVGGYANYENAFEGARDYAMYYKYVGYPYFTDVKSFVSALKAKGYFEDTLTNYMSGVNTHYKKLIQLLNVG